MAVPRSSHCQCANRGRCEHCRQQQLYLVGSWIGSDGNQFTAITPDEAIQQQLAFSRDVTLNQNVRAGGGRQVEGPRLLPAGPAADYRPIERAQTNVNPFNSIAFRRGGPVQYPAGPPRRLEGFATPSSAPTNDNQYRRLPRNPSIRPGQSTSTAARDINASVNRSNTNNGQRAATGNSNNAVRNGTSHTPGQHPQSIQTTTATAVTTRTVRSSRPRPDDNDSEDEDNTNVENNY